jgi:hypothetical protein
MVSVFVALGVAACSTPAPPEKDLSAALVASGINKEVSACTAKALTTSLTPSELAEITERGAGGAPVDDPAKTGESADKLAAAMAKCRELQVAASPTTTTTLAPAGDGAGSSTTLVAPGTDGAQLNPASTTTPS